MLNGLVALIAVLITGAVAAVSVIGGLPAEKQSGLVATDLSDRAPVSVESNRATAITTTTLAPRPVVLPRLQVPNVTAPVPDPTVDPTPTVVPAPPAAPVPATPAPTRPLRPFPIAPTTTAPPAPVVPPTWTELTDGIALTARIEPAEPHVGDTVTIFYTATSAGDVCCGSSVTVEGNTIAENPMPFSADGCPIERATSWSTTVEVSQEGPFSFGVFGTAIDKFCTGPTS
ncbi:MAG: hypothetical protein QOI56_255, partial [Actinomycetota bacterium]|nr:hypothetical protein [Actinomycetota bacterium]